MALSTEKVIQNKVAENLNMLVPLYLILSYAYYVEDDPLVSDAFYDAMAKQLYKEYDNVHHRHKHLIVKDALAAGSFVGTYPNIISSAYHDFRRKYEDRVYSLSV